MEGMRRSAAPGFTISDALSMEYRMCQRCVLRKQPESDFVEGIRAVLVDKDGKPSYDPPTLEAVTAASIESFFSPLEHSHPRGELTF